MPRTPKFTERDIAEAKRNKPGKLVHVTGTPNLYLLTSPGPKRKQRFIMRFSRPDGSGVTTRRIGPYPQVTLEIAKNTVDHARVFMAREKKNPFETDWNEVGTATFGQVARMWLDNRKNGWKNPKQLRNTEHLLFVVCKELVNKPIHKIKPKDVYDALKARWDRTPKQVRRALQKAEAVFDFAKTPHKLFFGDNPARWKGMQENYFPRLPKSEPNHFDAMPHEDVPEFMRALRQRQNGSVAAVALEFCILTSARRDEIRKMPWSEVDWENKIWVIPAERMKGEREHRVPLSDRAIELLKRRKEHAVGQYVFSAHQRNRPLDEKAMLNILHKMDDRYTVHGFRSTFRDWAGDETDYPRESIEECLAHQIGNMAERAYRRRTGLEKRRAIMKAWAEFCG